MSLIFFPQTLLIVIVSFGYIWTIQLFMPSSIKKIYEEATKSNDNSSEPRLGVINGQDAPPGSAPFVVSLRINRKHVCGGSLISTRTVLTAAHCVVEKTPNEVRYGTMQINHELYPDKQISEVIVHAQYNPDTFENDIALVILLSPVELSYDVDVIKVSTDQVWQDTPVFLYGWGLVSLDPDRLPENLQIGTLYIVAHETCREIYWNIELIEGMVCAGDDSVSACMGDSGAPLITKNNQLIGLVSWGPRDCPPGKYPTVFTRASTYLDWIETNMQ